MAPIFMVFSGTEFAAHGSAVRGLFGTNIVIFYERTHVSGSSLDFKITGQAPLDQRHSNL